MSGFGSPGSGAKSQIRPGGGFRQSFGSFSDEHENENAVASATAQKQAAQQSSVLGQSGVAKQQAADAGAGKTPLASNETSQQQSSPRNVTDLGEELVARPAKDILNTFKSFFDLNALLGINPGDSPDKKAKKQKVAQNWQKLTGEEQAYVQQKFQEEQQKKQREQEEEQQKKEEEAKQNEESIAPPSSPQKGPVGLSGSKKQQTATLMQNKRTQMTQADG